MLAASTGPHLKHGSDDPEPSQRPHPALHQKSEQARRGGGEGKSCHSWKGTLPPDRPTPAASDHIVPQESD